MKAFGKLAVLAMLLATQTMAQDRGSANDLDDVRCQVGINARECDEHSDIHPTWRTYVQRAIYIINHTSCAAGVEPIGRLLDVAGVSRQIRARIHYAMSDGRCPVVDQFLRERLAANQRP